MKALLGLNSVFHESSAALIVEGKLAKYYERVCLLDQRFIKDEDLTIRDHLKNNIARIGENIQVRRFVRFALSSGGEE